MGPRSTDPPPLTWWSHTWRLVLTVTISVVAAWSLAAWQWENARLWLAADLVLGVASLVAAQLRRRYPVPVAVLTTLATSVSATAAGPATLALMSLATRRRWREIVPVVVLALSAGAILLVIDPTTPDGFLVLLVLSAAVLAVTVGWGMYVGSRRELLATLRDRAVRAEAEQAARVAQARAAERTRIAREMHDVLAHRISLVTVHAGALVYREDLTLPQVRETAAVINDASHQALVELRQVLGILRDDPGDAAPERPQPSALDVSELVVEARRAGLQVETRQTVELAGIPDGVGRTLYRIVQEGLTNALKHAPGTRVVLTLSGRAGPGVDLEVRNPLGVGTARRETALGRTPESGLGLVGLSERAVLAGGRISHRVTAEREFVLAAWLPWPA